MYKELIRVKGTDLSIYDFCKKADKLNIYEEHFFDDFFNDNVNRNNLAICHSAGFIEEKDGYTILYYEE